MGSRPDDDHLDRLRSWPYENPGLWWAQQQRYYEIDRRRGYINSQCRRALERGAFIEHIDKKTVFDLCEGICAICEEPVTLKQATIDHVVPLSRGGRHAYDNVWISHDYCNRRKGDLLLEEMDDDLRYASSPKKRGAFYNSRSYRQAQIDRQRRAA